MADDSKKPENTKPPTNEELQKQLADAKAELEAKAKLEGELETVRAQLAKAQAKQAAGGSETLGELKYKSTVCRPEHQEARLAEAYPFYKPKGAKPPKVELKSFVVQDVAGANPPVLVESCCDESEAKRVAYQRMKVSPREIKLKAFSAEAYAKSQDVKAAAAK